MAEKKSEFWKKTCILAAAPYALVKWNVVAFKGIFTDDTPEESIEKANRAMEKTLESAEAFGDKLDDK